MADGKYQKQTHNFPPILTETEIHALWNFI